MVHERRLSKARVVDGLTLIIGIIDLWADEEGLVVAVLHQLVLLRWGRGCQLMCALIEVLRRFVPCILRPRRPVG
jgi:hypothetical protein